MTRAPAPTRHPDRSTLPPTTAPAPTRARSPTTEPATLALAATRAPGWIREDRGPPPVGRSAPPVRRVGVRVGRAMMTRRQGRDDRPGARRGIAVQEMVIYGVSFDMVGKQPIVLLKTVEGNKFLPIWIGHPEAAAILMKLQGASTPRPMTHDLVADMLGQLDAQVVRITVTELKEIGRAHV